MGLTIDLGQLVKDMVGGGGVLCPGDISDRLLVGNNSDRDSTRRGGGSGILWSFRPQMWVQEHQYPSRTSAVMEDKRPKA